MRSWSEVQSYHSNSQAYFRWLYITRHLEDNLALDDMRTSNSELSSVGVQGFTASRFWEDLLTMQSETENGG